MKMKKLYTVGKWLSMPFYYIHKLLHFLDATDLAGLIITGGSGFLFLGAFLMNLNLKDGEILSDVLFFFLCFFFFAVSSSLLYMAKSIIFAVALRILYPFAKLYMHCAARCTMDEEKFAERNEREYATNPEECIEPLERNIGSMSRFMPGCGMMDKK